MTNTPVSPENLREEERGSPELVPPHVGTTPDFDKMANQIADLTQNGVAHSTTNVLMLESITQQLHTYAAGLRVLEAEQRRTTRQTEAAINLAIGYVANFCGYINVVIGDLALQEFSREHKVEVEEVPEIGYSYTVRRRP